MNLDKNMKKYDTYKSMHDRLNRAISSEFYLEAIFIEYAILEDRLRSVLKHANIPTSKNGREHKISKKIDMIRSRPEFTESYYRKKFTEELLGNMTEWIKKRNDLIHDMPNVSYNDEKIKDIAVEGKEIVRIVKNVSKSVINHIETSGHTK